MTMTAFKRRLRIYAPSALGGSLIGGGLGALGGAAVHASDPYAKKKSKKKYILYGGLAGAGLGLGLGIHAKNVQRASLLDSAKKKQGWARTDRASEKARQQRHQAWESERQQRRQQWENERKKTNEAWEQGRAERQRQREDARRRAEEAYRRTGGEKQKNWWSQQQGGGQSQQRPGGGWSGQSQQRPPGFGGQQKVRDMWEDVPSQVRSKLRATARHVKDPANPEAARTNYRVIFEKLMKKHKIDGNIDDFIKHASFYTGLAVAFSK
jgi:hypothetical protein